VRISGIVIGYGTRLRTPVITDQGCILLTLELGPVRWTPQDFDSPDYKASTGRTSNIQTTELTYPRSAFERRVSGQSEAARIAKQLHMLRAVQFQPHRNMPRMSTHTGEQTRHTEPVWPPASFTVRAGGSRVCLELKDLHLLSRPAIGIQSRKVTEVANSHNIGILALLRAVSCRAHSAHAESGSSTNNNAYLTLALPPSSQSVSPESHCSAYHTHYLLCSPSRPTRPLYGLAHAWVNVTSLLPHHYGPGSANLPCLLSPTGEELYRQCPSNADTLPTP